MEYNEVLYTIAMPMTDVLPNFLCVGVEKAGTTSLYDLLGQHPGVGLSCNKETHFFNSHWDEGLEWYRGKFSHLAVSQQTPLAIGEITPAYHRFPEVIPRIQQTLGNDIKIVFTLREPCRRAFSHYVHDIANTLTIQNDFLFKTYLKTTPYATVVENYMNAFGKDNCLVLVFEEDLLPNPQVGMDKLFKFLNLPACAVHKAHSNPSYFPVVVEGPDYDAKIEVEGETIEVPANSTVVYTHRAKNTRAFSSAQANEVKVIQETLARAKTHVPAENLAMIFEQTVKADLQALQALIGRDLSCWLPNGEDLNVKYAPTPEFLPL